MNMSDAMTLNYYNSNAAGFSETTKNVDFSEVQQIFTKHLFPDASILDFGCGSGRDTKYFLNHAQIRIVLRMQFLSHYVKNMILI